MINAPKGPRRHSGVDVALQPRHVWPSPPLLLLSSPFYIEGRRRGKKKESPTSTIPYDTKRRKKEGNLPCSHSPHSRLYPSHSTEAESAGPARALAIAAAAVQNRPQWPYECSATSVRLGLQSGACGRPARRVEQVARSRSHRR